MTGKVRRATVHFTVTGSFLTRHIRQLWLEGRYGLAFETLDCLIGLEEAHKFGVIRGTHKLTDDNHVATDTWEPDLASCHLGQYPDPERMFYLAEQGADLAVEVERLQGLVCSLAVGYRRTAGGRSMSDTLERILESLPDEVLAKNGVSRRTFLDLPGRRVTGVVYGSDKEGWHRTPLSEEAKALARAGLPKVEDYVARQIELDRMDCPEPTGVKASDNGYITPDGAYYPCRWMEHKWLAMKLEEKGVDEKTLLKCANSQVTPDTLRVDLPSVDYWPTPQQRRAAEAWCLAWHAEIPDWLQREEGTW